jgi:hypothetical protein
MLQELLLLLADSIVITLCQVLQRQAKISAESLIKSFENGSSGVLLRNDRIIRTHTR